MIYLFIALLLLFLSIRIDINGKTKNHDFWHCVMLLVSLI